MAARGGQGHHPGVRDDTLTEKTIATDEQEYERKHVHEVYNQIASHFSSTRHKPWPIVVNFLRDRQPGAIGLDVGCGNGKYLSVNKDVFMIASDRSTALVEIASTHGRHTSIIADALDLPHRSQGFDFVISIAVVHHLSTRERRIGALSSMIDTLKRAIPEHKFNRLSHLEHQFNGELLVYVWALEQKQSRRGWDKGDAQDVMVPWVLKSETPKNMKSSTSSSQNRESDPPNPALEPTVNVDASQEKTKPSSTTFHRYYHLYREGELEQDIHAAGGCVLRSGYEKDNWWAVVIPSTQRLLPPNLPGTTI
ncbi:MAG: tRNA methyltransferase, has a role in tRNA modification [Vezdaea aestivalis]|nr:MAG: tRNA methyltransferase, has a role in tRNA modification [Vezdaea aestivalis]